MVDLNPFDYVKSGADWFGSKLDEINPLGINLGIGAVPRFIGNFVPGIAHIVNNDLGYGYGTLMGEDTGKQLDNLTQIRNALGRGVADTSLDVTSLGGVAPWTTAEKGGMQSAYGYRPHSLYDKSTNPGEGLFGGVINDAMNVAAAADGANFVMTKGTVGSIAEEANSAAASAHADTTGAVTPDSARANRIELLSRDKAAAEGLSGDDLNARATELSGAAARRAHQLEIVSQFQKPIKSIFQSVLRPVGAALNESAATGVEAPVTEAAPKVDTPAAAPAESFAPVPTPGAGEAVVYHGDNPAEIRQEGDQRWFTRNRTQAENHAGPDGHVYAHAMPEESLRALESQARESGDVGAKLGPERSQAAVDAGPIGRGIAHDLGGDVKTDEVVPTKTVAEHAAAYKAANGFEETGRPVPAGLEVDSKFHGDVAKAYDELKNDPHNPRVRAAYAALLHEVGDQFHFMTEDPNGPHVEVEFHDGGQKGSPYYEGNATDEVAHARMLKDLEENNHLYVNKTMPDEAHPVMNAEQNDLFRAVHDYFGHAAAGNNFGRAGEEIAYRLHSQMFSPAAREALATETRGQNSWLNFSGHNDLRRAAGESAEFPVQKAGILPAWARDEYPLLPQRAEGKMTPAEIRVTVGKNRPTPEWAKKIAPFVPPGMRAVAKFLDTVAMNRETAAILRENTRLIRSAAAGARLSPLVIDAIDVAQNHLTGGGMDPAEANVAVGQRATAMAGAGPIYTELLGKVDSGELPVELFNDFVAEVTGSSPTVAIPTELDTPEFRTRIENLAQMYREEKATALDKLANEARQGDRGLEQTEGSAPSLTKGDQGRLQLVQELQAKAAALRENAAPLERIQQQADILKGRDRLGALGAERQAAMADQAQAVADFDRARMPLSMRSDKVWGAAIDSIVQATLDPEGFGGTTFSQHTNAHVSAETGATYSVGVLPDTAIIVPLTGTAVVDAERLANAVDEVGHRYQDLLRDPDTVLGTWTSDGQVHIDVSQTTIDGRALTADQADILAAARRQQQTWDFQNSAERAPLLPQDIAVDLASTDMRQTARVMTQLRNTIDRINGITDPRAVARRPDVLISPEETDAMAAVMQRDAVMAFRNNPGRWENADQAFAGLDIKYLSPSAARNLTPEALLQRVMLGRDYTPGFFAEAQQSVKAFTEATQWYKETNAFLIKQFSDENGNVKPMLMPDPRVGGTREVSPVDVAAQLLGATSKNTPVRENLGQTMGILGRYSELVGGLGEHNVSGLQDLWENDYFAERRAGVKPYETTMAKRLFPGTGIGFSTSKTAVLEILSGETHDLWMEPVHEMVPEWAPQVNHVLDSVAKTPTGRLIEKAEPGLLARLRPTDTAGLPEGHPEIVTKLESMVAELRKAKAVTGDKEFSKLFGYLRQYSDQTVRLEDGRLPYLEARRPAMMDKAAQFGAFPQSLDPVVAINAINKIDPTIIPRIGEDRAVMEYYGGAAAAKPRSFAENIAHPENPDAATIDQHQARMRDVDEKTLSNPGVYLREAEALRGLRDSMNHPENAEQLSQALGRSGAKITAQEIQAGLWVHLRMLQGHEEATGGDFSSVFEGEHPTAHTFNANRELYREHSSVLWQRFQDRVLGAFTPQSDAGRAVMGFTRDANIGTLFHESAHWLRTLLGADDMDQLERAYDVKGGAWKAGHEERFAEDFMQYLQEGRGPIETAGVFDKIRNWLGGAWRIITRSGNPDQIDPAVRQVLDGWFHPEREAGPIDTSPTLPTPKDPAGASIRQLARRVPESAKFESPAQAAARGAEQQAALDKYSAAIKRARDTEIAVKKAQASVAKMEDRLHEPTQAELAAGALTGKIDKLVSKVQDHLNNPTVNRTPPSWQPVLRAAQSIADMVKEHPELEPILADIPQTFSDAVTTLEAAGFDPTHLSDWSTGKVRGLAYGTARLGPADRGVGTELIATSRKTRSGYMASRGLVNRSIESMAAMIAEPMQEARSNHVVDFMERNWARTLGHGEVPPKGWTLWSPVKRGLLGVETPAGEMQTVGEQMIIPTEVARVLRRYSADGVDNPMLRALQRVQSPWKSLLLTWSPKFYLNHILGHVVLGTLAGATRLSDWAGAYQSMRKGFTDMPEITAQSLVQAELGSTAFVNYPNMKTAIEGGGPLEAVHQVSRNLHRVVNTADSFARAAVAIADVRKGMTPEAALQHAAEALVDYNDLNALERTAVRSIVPFYGFQKGVLRLVMRLPIDHPVAAGMMVKIGQLNEKWAVDENGNPLPDAYSGVLDVPGLGLLDSKPINPLKDSESLVTPEGILGSLHPIVKLMVNAATGAPAVHTDSQGRIVANRGQTFHIGPTGAPVANINPGQELQSILETTPQLSAAGAGVGAGNQPGLSGVLSAILPLKNPDTIKSGVDRRKATEVALPKYGPEQAAKAYAKFLANQQGSSSGGLSGTADTILGQLGTDAPTGQLTPQTATGGQSVRLPSHSSGRRKKRSTVSQRGRILQAAYSRRGGSFHMKRKGTTKRIGKI